MGVSGCGKSTVGERLGARTRIPFIEGDTLHPPRNVALMAAGTPCPYEGQIGAQAKASWEANPDKLPKLDKVEKFDDTAKKIGIGALMGILVHKLF